MRERTLLLLAWLLTGCTSLFAAFELELASGWNLISLPEKPDDTRAEVVFGGVEENLHSVWAYRDGVWRVYYPGFPRFSDMSDIVPGEALWVYMEQSGTLRGTGPQATGGIWLEPGWSFIGHFGEGATPQETFDEDVVVYGYDNGAWRIYDPANPGLSDLQNLETGAGYWVYSESDTYADYGLKISDRVRILTDAQARAMVDGQAALRTNQSALKGGSQGSAVLQPANPRSTAPVGGLNLSVGDILVIPPTTGTPHGDLRKVTAINGNTYEYEMGGLEEVFESGTLAGSEPIRYDLEELNQAAARGVRFSEKQVRSAGGSLETRIAIDLNITKNIEVDGVSYAVNLGGGLDFRPRLDFFIDAGLFEGIRQVEFALGAELTGSLHASGAVGVRINEEIPLSAPVFGAPIFLGPLILVPQTEWILDIEGTVQGEVAAELKVRVTGRLGVGYDQARDPSLYPIHAFSFYPSYKMGAGISSSFLVGVGPKATLLLYGAAGPSFGLQGYADLRASVTTSGPDYGLYTGLRVPFGIRAIGPLNGFIPGLPWEGDVRLNETKLWPAEEAFGVLGGQVTDLNGSPLSGVTVTLRQDGEILTPSATTSGGGNWSVEAASGGGYSATFSRSGYRTATLRDLHIAAHASQTTETVRLAPLSSPISVSGRVEDGDSGDALPGAELRFFTAGGELWRSTMTDGGGNFSLSIDPGYYRIEVSREGYNRGGRTLTLVGSQSLADFSLDPISTGGGGGPAPAGFSLIPAGSFTMGSPSSESGRASNEVQHEVTLTRSFYLQQTEVTWAQWNEVRDWAMQNGYSIASGRNGYGGDASGNHPVTNVEWYDVEKWLNARSEREGLTPCYTVGGVAVKTGRSIPPCDFAANGYRLPTEAEWEYACRAGTTTAFYTGEISEIECGTDPNLDVAGWYCGNSGSITHPVGRKQPNAWGLYDMHGNVWEWCADWYGSYPSGSVVDPTGPSSGTSRVIRGSSFTSLARSCRSAFRLNFNTITNYSLGFRPARSQFP